MRRPFDHRFIWGLRVRILVLCYEYPPVGGGGGRIAAVVSGGLATRGHDVRVITSHTGDLPVEETSA